MELTTTTATELLRFHIPLLHSHLSLSSLKPRLLASTNKLKGSRFRLSSRKSIPTVRSLADETQFSGELNQSSFQNHEQREFF